MDAQGKAIWWKSKISRKLIFWVCLQLLVIEIIILIPSLQYYKAELISGVGEETKEKIHEFIHSQPEKHDSHSTIPLNLPVNINQLTIYTDDGALFYSSSLKSHVEPFTKVDTPTLQHFDSLLSLRYSSLINNRLFHVSAELADGGISENYAAHTKGVALKALLLLISVLVGTWIISQKVIASPLRRLITAFESKEQSEILDWDQDDELGELVNGYNSMVSFTKEAKRKIEVSQNHLLYRAYNDPLTNLPNRRAFTDRLYALDEDFIAMVFIVGIDGLKQINDQHGSDLGDSIIAANGARLANIFKSNYYCARLEGDEFGIILAPKEEMSEQSYIDFAKSVLELLNEKHDHNGGRIQVGASIGMAYCGGEHGDAETALKNSVIALQAAKTNGRSQRCLFDSSMRENIQFKRTMLSDMENAIKRDEFFPVYQPKISLKRQQILGAECLIRWRKSDGTIIPPNDFIPLAEESGLIIPIGEQLLKQSIIDAKEWEQSGFPGFQLAVNLSTVQLKDIELPERIKRLLTLLDFPANQLELEITESSIMEDADKATEIMYSLTEQGISLAIDDFGTGYSSLSYLKNFPVSTLKIDQSFVQDVCGDKDEAAIVNAVIDLAHHFNLHVVAEGIETSDQMNYLQNNLCDIGQGYYLGRPMPHDDFLEWCHGWNKKSA